MGPGTNVRNTMANTPTPEESAKYLLRFLVTVKGMRGRSLPIGVISEAVSKQFSQDAINTGVEYAAKQGWIRIRRVEMTVTREGLRNV